MNYLFVKLENTTILFDEINFSDFNLAYFFVHKSWKIHNPHDNELLLPMHLSAFCKPKVTKANGVYELHIVCIECIFKKHTDNQTIDTIYDFTFSYAICILESMTRVSHETSP